MFPKVPQSSLVILRVPQLPPPLNTPPLETLQRKVPWFIFGGPTSSETSFVIEVRSSCWICVGLEATWCDHGELGARFTPWVNGKLDPQKNRRKTQFTSGGMGG